MLNMFWITFWFLFYSYVGYPILLIIFAGLARRESKKLLFVPRVSIIIAAHNEEKGIKQKIENTLSLKYPKDKLEIIIVSDCSVDQTNTIIKEYIKYGVKLSALDKRRGKTAAQNEGVKRSTGNILVFSDATSIYQKDAISYLVQPFVNQSVGCVGGRLLFVDYLDKQDNLISYKSLLNNYDQLIKIAESKVYTTFGVDGCIYAVRNQLYVPLEESLTSDFVIPLKIIEKGYRTIYEPKAICFEKIESNSKSEYERKIRTVKAGLTGFWNMRKLLINRNLIIPWGLISHKFLRWLMPIFMIVLFLSNFFIYLNSNYQLYKIAFLLQLSFYTFALLGLSKRYRKIKIINYCFNFLVYTLATLMGIKRFLNEKPNEIWETNR